MPVGTSRPAFRGRRRECIALSNLVAAAKAGRGQVLVVRGEPGIGKTALLEYVLERATGCRVARAAGVESEMELPYAGLHQVCSPWLDRLGTLPEPQRDALGTAFGLRAGARPDRFLVGLAVLTLLCGVAEQRPLVCVVDDAQWLDRESAQALAFVARRLGTDPVGMVFATRDTDPGTTFAGLPEVVLSGLRSVDAAALLRSAVDGTLDPRVRDRILAESQGNPLALLELPRALSLSPEVAIAAPGAAATTPLVDRLEAGFLRQVAPLPAPARQLVLTAAAEPVGDVALLWRAADLLGIDRDAAAAAEAAGLIELGDRVRFRHPLVRSVVYRSATPDERRAVHRALADVTDPDADPDLRAWHRSRAAAGPDEDVAAGLERSADRALSRGGLASAAAFLEQAAALTPDPAQRVRRSLDAAEAKVHAGLLDDASALLATAERGPVGEPDRARSDLLRARTALAAGRGSEALPLLLGAARRLRPLDPRLARDTYLDALGAALFAGRLGTGTHAREVAEAAQALPRPPAPRRDDVLLDGLCVLLTEGNPAAAPVLRRAVQAFVTDELTLEEGLRLAWLTTATAASLWDDVGMDVLTERHLAVARGAGALSVLPLSLNARALARLAVGDLAAASSLVDEARAVLEVTGGALTPYGEVSLLALRGDPAQAEPLIEECLRDVTGRGEGLGVTVLLWARAVLCNGLGRYADALAAARDAAADPVELGPSRWALTELVEAAVRTGDRDTASAGWEQLSALAQASGTDWALGAAASRHALLRTGRAAEDLHREGIERLGRTTVRVELARAQLLYGEWLRREGRRVDARAQLRSAHDAFGAMGVDGFAARARREVLATGESVRTRTVETPSQLTAQEAHIARLAARGLTNPEIGAAMFLSPRTVEWHLRKVFTKLGVSTRRELRHALPDGGSPVE